MKLVKYLAPKRASIHCIVLLPAGVEATAEEIVEFVDDSGNFGWKVRFVDNEEPATKRCSYRGKVIPGYYESIKNEQAIDDVSLDRYYEVRVYID